VQCAHSYLVYDGLTLAGEAFHSLHEGAVGGRIMIHVTSSQTSSMSSVADLSA
jgi:hypothetical protein